MIDDLKFIVEYLGLPRCYVFRMLPTDKYTCTQIRFINERYSTLEARIAYWYGATYD